MISSRLDPPDDDAYDVKPNAVCADCGLDYSKGEHDRTVWCDECSNRRDLHTSLLEIRLMMARAYRSTRPVRDVA